MFTSGMKECSQKEIELKGITAKGLEKALEIIYTSRTTLENDDIFDVIAAASHLQVTTVIEFCEKNFLSSMTKTNFFDFISTAKLYHMTNALSQIDAFIAQNLLSISRANTLYLLSFEQIMNCLTKHNLAMREIDVFGVVWDWIQSDSAHARYAVELMQQIRFPLISPDDIVNKVQRIPDMMTQPELHSMVLAALNYHVVPHAQTLEKSRGTKIRNGTRRLVSVGGREIHPQPGLHDNVLVHDGIFGTQSIPTSQELTTLPSALSHMQAVEFNNFLYVLGGCTTQCAHGESAVNSVLRFDPRFNTWLQCTPMLKKRAYFFAGVVNDYIFAIGGKHKDGSLSSVEMYNPSTNSWTNAPPMLTAYHAHAGIVYHNSVYISGGYSNQHFTQDMQRFDATQGVWEDMAPMMTPRGWHVMVKVNSRFLVFGGCNLNANQQALSVLQSEMYDPETDQWTALSSLTLSHKEAACVPYLDYVCVLGGYNVQTKSGQKMVSKYDLVTGRWETIGSLPISMTGVCYCQMVLPSYTQSDVASP